MEPGGYFIEWNLQQAQLRIEDWERIRNRILRLGQDEAEEALEEQREGPDPEGRNQVYKLEGETTPKTTEALRKGNERKKLVSQEAGRTQDGSATPAVQWGSVPRRLFIPALQ